MFKLLKYLINNISTISALTFYALTVCCIIFTDGQDKYNLFMIALLSHILATVERRSLTNDSK